MEITPPKDTRVITQAELEAMPADKSSVLPHYELEGPVVINGDITDKSILVTGGSLWINGNVRGSDVEVASHAEQKALEKYEEDPSPANETAIKVAEKHAAAQGIGLYINGNVKHCEFLEAPNIFIGGDVDANPAKRPIEEKDIRPVSILAEGGSLIIEGNVTGQQATQDGCRIEHDLLTRPVRPMKLQPGQTLSDTLFSLADRLVATGNISVKGVVDGFGMKTETGSITFNEGKSTGFFPIEEKGRLRAHQRSAAKDKAEGVIRL